jgi:tetratricopeptide (TPR) repeat protein
MSLFRRSLTTTAYLLILMALPCGLLLSEEGMPGLSKEEKDAVVLKVIELIREHYIFPDSVEKIAKELNRRLGYGDYDAITDRHEFARRLKYDIAYVASDKHFHVNVLKPGEEKAEEKDFLLTYLDEKADSIAGNCGFKTARILYGNVGYLEISGGLPNDSMAYEPIVGAMNFLANADAIIIDLRKCNGGSASAVRYLCSFFFNEPVELSRIVWPKRDYTSNYWTFARVAGRKMPETPLFILTGAATFSAAEQLCYDMQALKRATVIGEKTPGGANPVSTFKVNEYFSMNIPIGRAVNPLTGSNWDGTGVRPDFQAPAEDALDIAVEKARAAAEVYRSQKKARFDGSMDAALQGIAEAEKLFAAEQDELAEELLRGVLEKAMQDLGVDELILNNLGYDYLGKENDRMAIAVFAYNAERYPFSANVWDSLGEAHMKAGNYEQAAAYYGKSLRLNPHNTDGRGMLDLIEEKLNAPSTAK